METTHANLIKPAGLSQTRSIVKARIDGTPNEDFHANRKRRNRRALSFEMVEHDLSATLLARNLLRDDGVIFVSIDDNEVHNLRELMNEVFGEENFVGNLVWRNATDNNPTNIATEHEYIICFAKNKFDLPTEWKSESHYTKNQLLRIGQVLAARNKSLEELKADYSRWFKQNRPFLGPLDRYKYIDFEGVYTGSQSVHNPGRRGVPL